jgi:NitT/TauT family transport system substrate-binding protein
MLPRRSFALALAGIVLTIAGGGQAFALDKVTFGTNWLAEAEHGGYYQAVADGTYAKYGLDVTIQQGGPTANNRMLLPVGKIEFYLGANMIQAFAAVEENIPTVVVAAIFQKDPQVLMSHPGVGLDRFEDLKKSDNILISKEGIASYYQWLKTEKGFSEKQVKPYMFNAAPFITDKRAVQQGYVTSEPYQIETKAGFKPNVFLLADYGFDTYSTTIETTQKLIDTKPDLVQRFVDASIIGWYNYIYGDNRAANALIKKDNPEMTDALLANGVAKMKEYGIVDSGDTLKLGVGAMSDHQIKSFFDKMVRAKVIKADTDYRRSYTLQFVNKGVGLALRPKQ